MQHDESTAIQACSQIVSNVQNRLRPPVKLRRVILQNSGFHVTYTTLLKTGFPRKVQIYMFWIHIWFLLGKWYLILRVVHITKYNVTRPSWQCCLRKHAQSGCQLPVACQKRLDATWKWNTARRLQLRNSSGWLFMASFVGIKSKYCLPTGRWPTTVSTCIWSNHISGTMWHVEILLRLLKSVIFLVYCPQRTRTFYRSLTDCVFGSFWL